MLEPKIRLCSELNSRHSIYVLALALERRIEAQRARKLKCRQETSIRKNDFVDQNIFNIKEPFCRNINFTDNKWRPPPASSWNSLSSHVSDKFDEKHMGEGGGGKMESFILDKLYSQVPVQEVCAIKYAEHRQRSQLYKQAN